MPRPVAGMDAPPIVAILGPTASGKSALALEAAEAWNAEIVTVDSAQVFRGLDIGTAKPTVEEQARVPHHLIDRVEPSTQWSAAEFQQAADEAIRTIQGRNKTVVLCGGTGLWYRALVHGIFRAPPIDPGLRQRIRTDLETQGSRALHRRLAELDPEAAAKIAPGDPQRIGRALEVVLQTQKPISQMQAAHGFRDVRHPVRAVALHHPRPVLWERIRTRTRAMIAAGWVDEIRALLDRGVPRDAPGLRIIGYRDMVRVAVGEKTLEAAEQDTYVATRQFAKRQANWFNQERTVHWVEAPRTVRELEDRLPPPDRPV